MYASTQHVTPATINRAERTSIRYDFKNENMGANENNKDSKNHETKRSKFVPNYNQTNLSETSSREDATS